jgi:hypothetical protein
VRNGKAHALDMSADEKRYYDGMRAKRPGSHEARPVHPEAVLLNGQVPRPRRTLMRPTRCAPNPAIDPKRMNTGGLNSTGRDQKNANRAKRAVFGGIKLKLNQKEAVGGREVDGANLF